MAIKTYYLLKKYVDTGDRQLPFYVEDVSGQSATLTVNTSYSDATNVEYSTDNVTWSSTKPAIPANGRVYIRAYATYWGNDNYMSSNTAKVTSNRNFNVGGNMMSLLYGSLFTGTETAFPDMTKSYIFHHFFAGTASIRNTTLISAGNLVLPATVMTPYCYTDLFRFCTNLTTAPALNATTLDTYCYSCMFQACTSLITMPILPAKTPLNGSYSMMFIGCSNLGSITVGATNWNNNPAPSWLDGVSATGTFTKPTNTTIPTGTSGIPSGWTVVNV